MEDLIRKLRESVLFRRTLGFGWHLIGIVFCYYCAFHIVDIRFDFKLEQTILAQFLRTLPLALVAFVGCILAFRLYQGLWRFFTFRDCLVTAIAFLTGSIVLVALVYVANDFSFSEYPRSVPVINYLLILGWEIGGRGFVRIYREWRLDRIGTPEGSGKNVVVMGDPEEADALIRSLSRQAVAIGKIVGVISVRRQHRGGKLHGIPIFDEADDPGAVVEKVGATMLLFLPPFTAPQKIKVALDSIAKRKLSCDYRVIPSIDDITSGKVDVSSIRKVDIEDLLHRKPYAIDTERMRDTISGKRVMVTGAGGSIGSEICRQVLRLNPASLTLFEVSEFLLFEIENELAPLAKKSGVKLVGCAADIRREPQIRSAMGHTDGIDIIYHAAAYKHVDLMERNPAACFLNNVVGTQILATAAEEAGVSQFVLISSDKAVRPTSLMGASKRLAERVITERPTSNTKFKAVRFGNVLGSSGSVVPIFRKQIAAGGPVTVTSKDVTRFFMTIPEAVELVLAAGAVGDDRRILVLEMGESVKIESLARRMIELSGFVPDVDIEIQFTGLKAGEKEYEELLTDDENVVRTDHDRIWVVDKGDDAVVVTTVDVGDLLEAIDDGDPNTLRKFAHDRIPGSKLMENSELGKH